MDGLLSAPFGNFGGIRRRLSDAAMARTNNAICAWHQSTERVAIYILMVESGARRFGDMIHVITVTISTGAAGSRKRVCTPFLIDA